MDNNGVSEVAPLGDRESAAEILKAHTEYRWDPSLPDQWAGMGRDDLTKLVGKIGSMIGFTPDQAAKTRLVFADNYAFTYPDRNTIRLGSAGFNTNGQGEYTDIVVLLNRSKEVARYSIDTEEEDSASNHFLESANKVVKASGEKGLAAHLKSPYEFVRWLIAEELKHSRTLFQFGSKEVTRRVTDRYVSYVKSQGIEHAHPYSLDIDELAASRNTLTILARLAEEEGDLERATYFKDLYKESLSTGRVVLPNVDNVFDELYISTGWTPDQLRLSPSRK